MKIRSARSFLEFGNCGREGSLQAEAEQQRPLTISSAPIGKSRKSIDTQPDSDGIGTGPCPLSYRRAVNDRSSHPHRLRDRANGDSDSDLRVDGRNRWPQRRGLLGEKSEAESSFAWCSRRRPLEDDHLRFCISHSVKWSWRLRHIPTFFFFNFFNFTFSPFFFVFS